MTGFLLSARPGTWPLVFMLLLGASLRLQWLETPLLDGHRWRQVDTAAIARNLYEDRFNVLYPQVDWGGRSGYVESEFPLLPAIAALSYKLFGQEDYYGRLISVVFSTATIAATFALARELLGTGAGLAAAFLVAVSPAAVFFGRTFMPDSTMLFFWVSGVLGFVRYFKAGSTRALWLGSAATALACLTKIPAVMMLAPIAGAAWHARGPGAIRDRRFLAALLVPLAITIAWYWHAFLLFRQTGLTFGILLHPAKTYPIAIAPGPWAFAFSKWSTVALLTSPNYYRELAGRVHHFLLLPWGLAGALVGAAVWKRAEWRHVADAWLAALAAFVLVAGEANISHEYYQLPIVPLAGLYFGAFAGPIFERGWLRGPARAAGAGALAVVVGVAGFYFSGVITTHFRPGNLDLRSYYAGQAVQRVVPADALVVVVDEYGITSPMLLYFSHRKGWSFDPATLHPLVIEGLKRRGARYFVSTVWTGFERLNADAARYLRTFPQVQTPPEVPDLVVFDIGAERNR